MKTKKTKFIFFITGGLLIILTSLFLYYKYITKKEHPIKIIRGPWSSEAKENRFLAFQRILEKNDFTVKLSDGIPSTLGSNETLFYAGQRSTIDNIESAKLTNWVEHGGHLIITPKKNKTNDDPLLQMIKVRYKYNQVCKKKINISLRDKNYLIKYHYTNNKTATKNIKYRPIFYKGKNSHYYGGDRKAPFLLQIKQGKGMITIIANLAPFNNYNLPMSDHALFLYDISTFNDKKTFWIILHDKMPSLIVIIWKHGWPLVTTLFILLFFWIWFSAMPFGPKIIDTSLDRRSLMEHIEASALFLWRYRQSNHLISSRRKVLFEIIKNRYPKWSRLREQNLIEKLAEISSIKRKDIAEALYGTGYSKPKVFRQYISNIKKISDKL